MSFGIEFNTDIFISGETSKTKHEVESAIDEIEQAIIEYREQLKMFTSSTPCNIVPTEWKEEPIRWISIQVNDILNEMSDLTIKSYQLNLYLNVLNNIKD